MAKENILVIDNEPDTVDLIKNNLDQEGYRVSAASSAEQSFKKIKKNNPDLIIMDLVLPDIDGFDVCRKLKSDPDTDSIPIIILSSKGDESDIVAGLELGASDYVTKPFSIKVLIARIRTILRRFEKEPADQNGVIKIKDLFIHPGRREVRLNNQRLYLTSSEFDLFYLMASRPGWVFGRRQIVEALRGKECYVTGRSVDVKIAGLRKNLRQAGKYIETVRGVGYRFKP